MPITVNTGFDTVDSIYNYTFQRIKDSLKSKYGVGFDVVSYDDRSFSHPNVICTYCCPVDDPTVVFSANLNTISKEIADDFPLRKLNSIATKAIEEKLESVEYGRIVEVNCNCNTQDIDVLAVSLDDIIRLQNRVILFVNVCVDENADPEQLYTSIISMVHYFSALNESVRFGIKVWRFNENSLEIIRKKTYKTIRLSDSFLERLGPINTSEFAFVHGNVHKDIECFASEMNACTEGE